MEEKNIHISDLYKSMDTMMNLFEEFQDALRKQKPENWERDVNVIDALKKNLSKTYINLIELES